MNIESLLMPIKEGKVKDRRVWGIPLEGIWTPFFTATNVEGKTEIDPAILGAPIRLAKYADGSVKFSKTGKPIFRVTPEMSALIKLIRENFMSQLDGYTKSVMAHKAKAFKEEQAKAQKAAKPLLEDDAEKLSQAIEALKAKELAEAVEEAEVKAKAEGAKVEEATVGVA